MSLDTALKFLQLLLELAPPLAEWIEGLISGKTDPVSLRVKDILPQESESRKAQRELGG